MDDNDKRGFGYRIGLALQMHRGRVGRAVTLTEVRRLVAAAEGRDSPYGKSSVSAWIAEANQPSLAAFEAIAMVFGGDASWYAFGIGNPPSNPVDDLLQPAPRSP